ncbi:formylglycine-generating enzyme family protein [Nocardioides sp. LHG3406-4]|uniref:formylglycine-generating enzyme family protein n=1 Tax=Nocardioides sp. LHG3406-4 TaxID=2804575 RepID=UPI003CE78771
MSNVTSAQAMVGMVRVSGGSYLAGDDRFYAEERPVTEVTVGDLWVDVHPVTNALFRWFVEATGYVTVAESQPPAEDFDGARPEDLVPGSLVFTGTSGPVPLDDWTRWWSWVPGADWRRPQGGDSTLLGRELHPVVHVAFEDAQAYATWASKALPTEAEWEFLARGGLAGATYAWGDDFMPGGRVMANTWHGRFPWENIGPHGFHGTSPVGTFPANGYGLHDVTGNVWEWTNTPWTADRSPERTPASSCCAPVNATALAETDRRVTKGGSHLCAPSYCLRYRPAARQGHSVRSSTSHLGFRCVVRE